VHKQRFFITCIYQGPLKKQNANQMKTDIPLVGYKRS